MTRQHFDSMDGMRGIAALAVTAAHIEMIWARGAEHATRLFPGQLAVDIFFVLSGFVMAYSYLDRPTDWRSFAVARFARIYPLHIASALAMLAMAIAATMMGQPANPAFTPLEGLEEVLLLSALPGFSPVVWNIPSWSISIEWWMYFTLFPILAVLTGRIGWQTAAVVILPCYLAFALYLNANFDAAGTTRGWIAVGRGVLGFSAGWLVWRIWRAGAWVPPAIIANACLIVLVLAWYGSHHVGLGNGWYVLPVIPVLILSLACRKGIAVPIMAARPFVWLGDISYSIYLLHMVVLVPLGFVVDRLGLELGLAAWFAIALPPIIALSAASYYLFERPMRDLIRSADRRSRNPVGQR